jgi:hypothetical protein
MSTPLAGDLPTVPLLTVEQAAGVLQIGRSHAYKLVSEYRDTGGMSGVPVISIGGCLRVPRWALLRFIMTGEVVPLCDPGVAEVIRQAEQALAPDGD